MAWSLPCVSRHPGATCGRCSCDQLAAQALRRGPGGCGRGGRRESLTALGLLAHRRQWREQPIDPQLGC